ncbi:MAG TPA: CHAT domain-containing protein [Ornithinibacter sp.]|nr:CHAT domain-containing protein [Ornithinibacter sp.]
MRRAAELLAQARRANEVGRFEDAAAGLDDALEQLESSGHPDAGRTSTRIRITRSWSELELRGLEPALAMLRLARADAARLDDPILTALTYIQEGTLHGRVGDWPSCLAALTLVGALEDGLDPAQQWALHLNLGQAYLGVGRTAEAATEFERARDIAVDHDLVDQEFKARHNQALAAFLDGDLARALVLMRQADAMDAAVSRDRARLDQAEVLLEAGLVDGARAALSEALTAARSEGHRLEEGEISLRLARCDLLAGDLDGARRHVRQATAAYRTRQAVELVREAELVRATVDVAAGHHLPAVVTAMARRTEHTGATRAADRAAVRLEAEARLLLGDLDGAEDRLATLGRSHRESLPSRLHETLVRARLDAGRGRHVEAERRITTGNRLLAAHQFQSSSLEVRAALALHGRRLALFDVERAIVAGDPDGILTSVERWRAISHRINPVTTSTDPELTTLTRELRRLRRLVSEHEGQPPADIVSQVAHLEEQVSQREWSLTVGDASVATVPPVDSDEARGAAADRGATVVEFFEFGGDLWTILLEDGRLDVTRMVAVDTVRDHVTRLRRDLRAHAMVAPGSPMDAVLARATASSLAAVDHTFNPGGRASARVVIIPSRSLAAVPWSLLPSLAGRPVTVAPSLTRWVRGSARGDTAPGNTAGLAPVAALYGPGLARTGPEIRAVRAAWSGNGAQSGSGARSGGQTASDAPDADTDMGSDTDAAPATSDDVIHALDSARVVHLAAHGTHEAQSPLFSSVRMADGPVFAHEFPRPVAAEHVALSACDVGQFSTRAGDEPLGLATALLSLGATSVLAAVAPVADHVAADAMVAYHEVLATGEDAATAWSQAAAEHPGAGVFCLYGSDWRAVR